MDLIFSEEQQMLRDMTRRLCEDFAPLTVLRQLEGTEPGYSDDFWKALIDAGMSGLTIADKDGGLGLGATEMMIVHEEFGRALAFSPHFVSSVLAAHLISTTGNTAQRQRWLPSIASGQSIVSIGSLEPQGGHELSDIQCSAKRTATGYRLSGTKHFVAYAARAHAAVILARVGTATDDVIALLVDLKSPGVSIQYQPNHAREAVYQVTLRDVDVSIEDALKDGQPMATEWQDAMYSGLIALAAQAVGGAERAHAMAVEYAKVREAFGKPIGSFQAVAHSLADVAVDIEGCRMLVRQAAWAKDRGYDFHRVAAIAKLQACEMYRRTAGVTIQVHGGIGFTNDADPQLFFRRAKHLQLLHWDSDYLEERIIEMVLQETSELSAHGANG
jgi:alkylation response protein AidB-like acyl-CoA dehydrogenase